MPHMMGARGAAHTGLKFTDMKLDKKYLLGEEGQGMEIAIHSLSVSRAHIAASNLGMCQRMLERCPGPRQRPHHLRQADRFPPDDQARDRRDADVHHALRCMVYDFGREYDADPNGKYIEEKAAMRKLFSIYSTRIVSDGMLEIFGGDSYFSRTPLRPDRAPVPRRPRHVARGGRPERPAHHHCPQLPEVRRQGRVPAVITL